MAAKLQIDREQVRILVIQEGVRGAARILGLNENTVSAWSARYGWIQDLKEKPLLPASMVQRSASNASTPADLLVREYRERRMKTRLMHSKIALENVEHLAEMPVNQRLADGGQTLTAVVKHAAIADNWDADSSAKVVVCLQALATQPEPAFLEIEEADDAEFR